MVVKKDSWPREGGFALLLRRHAWVDGGRFVAWVGRIWRGRRRKVGEFAGERGKMWVNLPGVAAKGGQICGRGV